MSIPCRSSVTGSKRRGYSSLIVKILRKVRKTCQPEAYITDMENLNRFHPDDLKNALCELLLTQARQCRTAMGSALLLSIKNHIEGQVRWEGMSELWEVADHYEALISKRLKELKELLTQNDCDGLTISVGIYPDISHVELSEAKRQRIRELIHGVE